MKSLITESGAEILKGLRAPEFILPTLLLPMVFYAIFGVLLSGMGNNARYLLATYGIFAVMGPSIFGFGVSVANERDQGWLQIKRASPAHGLTYIAAKVITTLLFATVALAPIYFIAGLFGDVAMPRSAWFLLYTCHIIAVLPFIFIGLSLGFSFSSNGAIAISNIVFLGLAILGGLWFPVEAYPNFMQKIASFTPSYHLAELALAIVDAPGDRNSTFNIIVAFVMTAIFATTAFLTWLRQR